MLTHAGLRDRGVFTAEDLVVQDLYNIIMSLLVKKSANLAACTQVALFCVLELYVKVSCSD